MTRLIWLHDKWLNPNLPQQLPRQPTDRVIFIWDDAYLKSQHFGFNRLRFLYDTLCDIDAEIYQGDTLTTLKILHDEIRPAQLITVQALYPELKEIQQKSQQQLDLTLLPYLHLVPPPKRKLRRFFAFWKSCENSLIAPNNAQTD